MILILNQIKIMFIRNGGHILPPIQYKYIHFVLEHVVLVVLTCNSKQCHTNEYQYNLQDENVYCSVTRTFN